MFKNWGVTALVLLALAGVSILRMLNLESQVGEQQLSIQALTAQIAQQQEAAAILQTQLGEAQTQLQNYRDGEFFDLARKGDMSPRTVDWVLRTFDRQMDNYEVNAKTDGHYSYFGNLGDVTIPLGFYLVNALRLGVLDYDNVAERIYRLQKYVESQPKYDLLSRQNLATLRDRLGSRGIGGTN